MNTKVMFFRKYDWKTNQKEWFKFIGKNHNTKNCQVMAIYFNEDMDMYKVYLKSISGEEINLEIFSWDELSRFIYDNT